MCCPMKFVTMTEQSNKILKYDNSKPFSLQEVSQYRAQEEDSLSCSLSACPQNSLLLAGADTLQELWTVTPTESGVSGEKLVNRTPRWF